MASISPPLPTPTRNADPPSSPTNSTTHPPSTPASPAPETPPLPPAAPPPESLPSPPAAPPPKSPPPPTPVSPPSPPTVPPPTTSSPPPPPTTSPPPPSSVNSPPPESPTPPVAPPPPSEGSSPPESTTPPVTTPPPPPSENSPPPESPVPPVDPPPPHPASSPSPPSPSASPPPPSAVQPPDHPPPRPPLESPPIPSTASPPLPSNTSSSLPPSTSPPPPLNNSSTNSSLPSGPLPSRPTEKPTAGSTQSGPNIISDTTPRNSGGPRGGSVVAVGSIVGFLALGLLVLAVWFTRKRKRSNNLSLGYNMPSPFASSQNSDPLFLRSQYSDQLAGSVSAGNNNIYSPDHGMGTSRSWFSYQELSLATNRFSENNLLGEGGFGCVYKGVLVDGREVAVKQLKVGGGQGEREFRAEVEIISRIHHRHLVSLVGYCIAENQRLLVYDYVPNDTLHHHLHASEGKGVIDWASRVKVAAGAARGLAYLHEDCQPRIIHRDIKSTNILLDNNFEAQVADFGLAKLALELDIQTHVSTRVMGTFGYLAPEYASTGKLTEKSDVYSFGVVLLELITGRKPVDSAQPLGDESLVEWARPLLTQALDKEEFGDIVDPKLENNFVASEMFRVIEAAAACVRHSASKRPKMSQVARALDSMYELEDLNNGVKPGQSGIYTSSEHSAQIRMFQRMAFGSQDYNSDHSQTSWS